jgi:hypothetical protein
LNALTDVATFAGEATPAYTIAVTIRATKAAGNSRRYRRE